MAVTQQQTVYNYDAAGGTFFAFGFRLLSVNDLKVTLDGVAKVAGVDFSVIGVGQDSGGAISFSAPVTGKLRIYRATQVVRSTDYQIAGDFPASVVNADFDKTVMILQDLLGGSLEIGNTLRVPAGDFIPTIADRATRAGKVLGFDDNGDPAAVVPNDGSAADVALALAAFQTLMGAFQTATNSHLGTLDDSITTINSTIADTDAIQEAMLDAAAGTAVIIDLFGDSLLWGANPDNLAAQVAVPPDQQLQNVLNNYFGNGAVTVVNKAISGTTSRQMLLGTDGSGKTFEQRVAESGARIIYCDHCENNAYGTNATTAAVFRDDWEEIIRIVRKYNKTIIAVTPPPTQSINNFPGSQARANAVAHFAQIQREVCIKKHVQLVDIHAIFTKLLTAEGYAGNVYQPATLLKDGLHLIQFGTSILGNNLGGPLIGPRAPRLSKPNQRIPITFPNVEATGQTITASGASRLGSVVTSGTSLPQKLRAVFWVDETGLDLSILHPIWNSGATDISVNLDGVELVSNAMKPFSMYGSGFTSSFLTDFETLIQRCIIPGFHILQLTTLQAGAVGLFGLRSRAYNRPLLMPSANADPLQYRQLAPRLELNSTVANTICLFDDLPAPRFTDVLHRKFVGQLLKTGSGSGVVIGSNVGNSANSPAVVAERAIMVGLNSSGFLVVQEATGPGAYATAAVLGATDLSLASHSYRFKITSASPGQISVYVDESLVGTVNLSQPYYGGVMGLWKSASTGSLVVTDVCEVWGL